MPSFVVLGSRCTNHGPAVLEQIGGREFHQEPPSGGGLLEDCASRIHGGNICQSQKLLCLMVPSIFLALCAEVQEIKNLLFLRMARLAFCTPQHQTHIGTRTSSSYPPTHAPNEDSILRHSSLPSTPRQHYVSDLCLTMTKPGLKNITKTKNEGLTERRPILLGSGSLERLCTMVWRKRHYQQLFSALLLLEVRILRES